MNNFRCMNSQTWSYQVKGQDCFLNLLLYFGKVSFKRVVAAPVEIFHDCCKDLRKPMKCPAQEQCLVGSANYPAQMGSLHSPGMAGTTGPILLVPKEWFLVPVLVLKVTWPSAGEDNRDSVMSVRYLTCISSAHGSDSKHTLLSLFYLLSSVGLFITFFGGQPLNLILCTIKNAKTIK